MPTRLLLHSIAMTVLLEGCITGSLTQGFLWIFSQPLAFAFSTALIFLSGLFLISVFNSLRISVLVLTLFSVLFGAVGFLKQAMLGTPLFPSDLLVFHTIKGSLSIFLNSETGLFLFILGGASTFLFYLVRWSLRGPNYYSRKPLQWGVGLAALFFMLILVLRNNPLHDALFDRRFLFKRTQAHSYMKNNGPLISFISLIEKGTVRTPKDFSVERVKQIYRDVSQAETNQLQPKIKPDIVVVMSESLFDPTELKGIKWKKDPLAFTRSLTKGLPLSRAVVPTFGGKTANSEFEFLTGHAVRFFASGTVPYEGLTDPQQLTLIKTLKSAGYKATAIHPGKRDFWNREKVYQDFGFDQYLSEESFTQAPHYGHFVSDDSILDVLKSTMTGADPSFHFIVTLQNHMPYNNPFDFRDMLFEEEGLSKAETAVMNHYSKVLAATDRFHKSLVEFLSSRHRPTVLVIFGDHLPPLMDHFGMYVDRFVSSSEASDWSQEEWRKMYTTPLVVWSNFALPPEKSPKGVSFLGVRLLRSLGFQLEPYHRFVASVSDKIDYVSPYLNVSEDKNGLLKDYEAVQYYTLVDQNISNTMVAARSGEN